MKKIIFIIVIIGLALFWYSKKLPVDTPVGNALEKKDLIVLNTPKANDVIKSPLVIEGQARGYWFFEASFPIVLTDWDGKIIAEHYAEAQGEPARTTDGVQSGGWMTEDFVPFKSTLTFTAPAGNNKRGFLILKKDNPSGLPEHDDALEIPVTFE